MAQKVAFIGLGVMGFPMAGHLAAKGYDVCVFNRTTSKAEQFVAKHGGRMAPTPQQAAQDADFVFCCVGNDDDVHAVTIGEDGALAGMGQNTILVDHTTASAGLAREVGAACGKKGIGFIDAPVSGGQAGAENGALTIMCGGETEHFTRAETAMQSYGRAVTLMGPTGSGQLTKMVNQICIAGLVQALSEGINFSQRVGLDTTKVLAVIGKGAAQSWQMDNRGGTMRDGKFDFGFAVDWMRKDLGICLAEANRQGARLPVTALVDQFYAQIQARDGGRWDTSSLYQLLAKD